MKSFDPYTKRILLEAVVAGSTFDPTGGTRTPGPITGVGAPKKKGEVSPLKATPEQIWFGTHDEMPVGANLKDQAGWGYHKQWVNKYLEGITAGGILNLSNSIAGAVVGGVADMTKLRPFYDTYGKGVVDWVFNNPVTKATAPMTEFAVKQAVRTAVAKEYLGGTPSKEEWDSYGPVGALAKEVWYGIKAKPTKYTDPSDPSKTIEAKTTPGRFGKLGQKVSEKLPELAKMGIDPLEFSTKMFGADDALSAYSSVASGSQANALGAMGYLSKGIQKGVYNLYK